jgi:hypothetical protein
VYVILADYLPNSTGYASKAGLTTSGSYGVYTSTYWGASELTGYFSKTTAWEGLANGISGATVVGTPTKAQIETSYSKKYGTSWNNSTAKGDSLYTPHNVEWNNMNGYWLNNAIDTRAVYYQRYEGYASDAYCYANYYAIRPVVSLPSSCTVEGSGSNLWKVQQ